MTTTDKAIALSKLGLKVFPWKLTEEGRKIPLTESSHLDATDDAAQIMAWFKHPDVRIGVHAGASGLLVADVDVKNGKNGFEATHGWVDFPETFSAPTASGGTHFIYAAPEGIRLAPATDFNGFDGLDVRAGSSWFAWWSDEVPESRDVFTLAPEWLCEPAKSYVGSSFEGGLDEWFDTLVDPQVEPNGRVLDAIGRIPDSDFGHTEMIERVWEIVRLGAEGAPGVLHALALLRDAWLREPWDTDDNRYSFDKAIDGAIKKAGALDELIANLPKYGDLLVRQEVLNATSAANGSDKADWFRNAKTFIRFLDSDDEVASVLWHAPSTKDWSREWGIDFVYERIADLRSEVEADDARIQQEVEKFTNETPALPNRQNRLSLLTADERKFLALRPNFIHRYLSTARERFPMLNEPYHRANAWTILSLTLGPTGFVPVKGKNLGLNLYQITPGLSSSGKSDSIIMRDEILRLYFADDLEYDLGIEASGEVAHEYLLERGGKPTFLNTDEADGFFRELTRTGSWQAKLQSKVTDWHGGWVGPVHKRAYRGENKGGSCFLVSHFFATPDELYSVMETRQFLSGFLARYQWSIGEKASEIPRTVDDMQDDEPVNHEINPSSFELSHELQQLAETLGKKRPYKADKESLARLLAAEGPMSEYLKANADWKITESAYRRLLDALRKCTALLAASRGVTHIEYVDILGALEQAEYWLAGLVEASSNVSSSVFEREAREIAVAVKSMGNPWVTHARLWRSFSRYDPMEFDRRIMWAVGTGMIVREEAGKEHGIRYGWKGGEE